MCSIFRTIFYYGPITLRELARISKTSLNKTSRVVAKLKKKELVKIRVLGRSYLISPNLESNLTKHKIIEEEASYTIITLEKYPWVEEKLKKCKGDVIILFGSYAAHEADELSDIDVLTINGKGGDFNLSLKKFRKLLNEKNNTILSILKKHMIYRGYEIFVNEVIEWKRKSYGALK